VRDDAARERSARIVLATDNQEFARVEEPDDCEYFTRRWRDLPGVAATKPGSFVRSLSYIPGQSVARRSNKILATQIPFHDKTLSNSIAVEVSK
jgi:hypothetical protein